MLFVSPPVHSVGLCRNLSICPCLPSPVCLPRGFPPSNTGNSWLLSEVALLVMHKQQNCFVLLASPYGPLFTFVNVRLYTMCLHSKMYNCASIENVYMLANSRILYLQYENPAFSTTDMLQYIIWVWSNGFLSKAHLTTFNICCLDCVDCMLLVLRQYLVYELIFDIFLATVNCLIYG